MNQASSIKLDSTGPSSRSSRVTFLLAGGGAVTSRDVQQANEAEAGTRSTSEHSHSADGALMLTLIRDLSDVAESRQFNVVRYFCLRWENKTNKKLEHVVPNNAGAAFC